MPESEHAPQKALETWLIQLENLNPDLTGWELFRIWELARQTGPEGFDMAVAHTERLIDLYLASDVKQKGKDILAEYFFELDKCAKKLCDKGLIAAPIINEKASFTTAMVPAQTTTALDRCRIMNRVDMPALLTKAADAFRRRNEVVETVLEIAFRILWLLDENRAIQWFKAYFAAHDKELDPDVIRDALTTLSHAAELPMDVLAWAERWSVDPNLREYWPLVTRKADKLLCGNGLRNWAKNCFPRNASLAHLRLMVRMDKLDDDSLLAWLRRSLDELGECVLRFMALENSLEGQGDRKDWIQVTLFSELKRIASLFPVMLMACDQLLCLPDGTEQLAMAFMGLSGKGRDLWEKRLLEFSIKVIRRTFVYDMRAHRTPVETIRRLTFGDDNAFRAAYAELDFFSEQFDSYEQREKVIRKLAVYYASYRHVQLIGAEIAKRYRSLMRMLHEDFLRQYLTEAQLKELAEIGVLRDLATQAAAARRYLARRRKIESTLEDMMASKIDYEQAIRNERLGVFRRLMDKSTPTVPPMTTDTKMRQ